MHQQAETPSRLAGVSIEVGRRLSMRFIFLVLALLLFFTWIGAFVVFHVSVALIHLLLALAVIFVLVHVFGGRRPTAARP